jgi:hypothetical protein
MKRSVFCGKCKQVIGDVEVFYLKDDDGKDEEDYGDLYKFSNYGCELNGDDFCKDCTKEMVDSRMKEIERIYAELEELGVAV